MSGIKHKMEGLSFLLYVLAVGLQLLVLVILPDEAKLGACAIVIILLHIVIIIRLYTRPIVTDGKGG